AAGDNASGARLTTSTAGAPAATGTIPPAQLRARRLVTAMAPLPSAGPAAASASVHSVPACGSPHRSPCTATSTAYVPAPGWVTGTVAPRVAAASHAPGTMLESGWAGVSSARTDVSTCSTTWSVATDSASLRVNSTGTDTAGRPLVMLSPLVLAAML